MQFHVTCVYCIGETTVQQCGSEQFILRFNGARQILTVFKSSITITTAHIWS